MPFSLSKDIDSSLVEFIIDNSLANQEQITPFQGNEGKVVESIVSGNLVSEEQIAQSFSSAYGLKKININDESVNGKELADRVPNDFITQYRIIPIQSNPNQITAFFVRILLLFPYVSNMLDRFIL